MQQNIIIGELLKRSVAYKPIIGKAFGNVNLGVLWCQLFFWQTNSETDEGWVKKSWNQLYFETGLSRQEQRSAMVLGKKLGVIETDLRGFPRETYYRVSQESVILVVEEWLTKNPEQADRMAVVAHKGLFGTEVRVKQSDGEIPLAPWVDKEAWAEWEAYRKEIKKSLKPATRKAQLAMLEKNKADHAEIIRNSIRNGWTGLFELKGKSAKKATNVIVPVAGKFAKYGSKS